VRTLSHNVVGTNFFMQTLELALVLQDVEYGADGEILGFDLYPYAISSSETLHAAPRGFAGAETHGIVQISDRVGCGQRACGCDGPRCLLWLHTARSVGQADAEGRPSPGHAQQFPFAAGGSQLDWASLAGD